jgi:hypothetical protein
VDKYSFSELNLQNSSTNLNSARSPSAKLNYQLNGAVVTPSQFIGTFRARFKKLTVDFKQ